MSGTSADGIDVAIARITPNREGLKIGLLSHHASPFTGSLRAAILAAMDARSISTAELARLNWRLGEEYATALDRALKRHPAQLDLVGCHGQTIYHQGAPQSFLGRKLACTWQIGEMALLAARAGVPVVSNFRPADMVAGGQGAPLVSLLDYVLFRHPRRGRVLQNIGGIGNLTAVPPAATIDGLLAFDTGPGNMVIDYVAQKLFEKRYDAGGRIAEKGKVLTQVLTTALKHPLFRAKPPKSAGREEFGAAYARNFLDQCARASSRPEDAVATATALTAHSIKIGYERFAVPLMKGFPVDYFVSGGGARNATLLKLLKKLLEPLGCSVRAIDDAGLPSEAKEAVAFALLAYQTWHCRPGNVPAATGASRPAILGNITYV